MVERAVPASEKSEQQQAFLCPILPSIRHTSGVGPTSLTLKNYAKQQRGWMVPPQAGQGLLLQPWPAFYFSSACSCCRNKQARLVHLVCVAIELLYPDESNDLPL